MIGNRDNHAKNLSRLKTNPRSPRWELAPFYDLLNTTGYELLTRKLAFRIGGADEVQQIRAPQLRARRSRTGCHPCPRDERSRADGRPRLEILDKLAHAGPMIYS